MLKPYIWRSLATLMIVAVAFKWVPALAQEPPPAGSRPPLLYTQGYTIENEDGSVAVIQDLFRLDPDGTSTRINPFPTESVGLSPDSISPDQQQIAFSVSKDFLVDSIYRMELDGSNLIRLVGDELKGTGPTWSPDGTRIAFSAGHYREGEIGVVFSSNLAVMNADGSNQQIIVPETNILIFPLFWLPDGQRLIFEGTDENYFSHIYSIQADGSGLICVTCPPPSDSVNSYGPFWYQLTLSSDGQQAAYVGRNNDLYIVNTSNGEQHNLTPALNERIVQPAWSPDSQRLAFGREDLNPGLAVINADGSNLTHLPVPPGAVYEPLWSPDGQKIAFTYFLNSAGDTGGEHLYVIDADGSGLAQLTRSIDKMRIIENYTWTPDSSHLIFSSTLDEDNSMYALYQVKADGSNLTRLTEPNLSTSFGAWLPE